MLPNKAQHAKSTPIIFQSSHFSIHSNFSIQPNLQSISIFRSISFFNPIHFIFQSNPFHFSMHSISFFNPFQFLNPFQICNSFPFFYPFQILIPSQIWRVWIWTRSSPKIRRISFNCFPLKRRVPQPPPLRPTILRAPIQNSTRTTKSSPGLTPTCGI